MEKFLSVYKKLNANNLNLLADIYTEDICFIDPVHQIDGLDDLGQYFEKLYKNIDEISFTFDHSLRLNDEAYVQWTMELRHPKLKKAKKVTVEGSTYLRFSLTGKVCYHRDYFDLGEMIYEQLPLVATLIRAIKRRISS